MIDTAKDLDLSVLPPEYRAVFEAQAARVALSMAVQISPLRAK